MWGGRARRCTAWACLLRSRNALLWLVVGLTNRFCLELFVITPHPTPTPDLEKASTHKESRLLFPRSVLQCYNSLAMRGYLLPAASPALLPLLLCSLLPCFCVHVKFHSLSGRTLSLPPIQTVCFGNGIAYNDGLTLQCFYVGTKKYWNGLCVMM